MRLWHQDLIPRLPNQQLLGQHRECCALRGKGWGKKHSTVDYVFTYEMERLVAYHWLVIAEMERRGYKSDYLWSDVRYRGKNMQAVVLWDNEEKLLLYYDSTQIYPEHNEQYLQECLENLQMKGAVLYEVTRDEVRSR